MVIYTNATSPFIILHFHPSQWFRHRCRDIRILVVYAASARRGWELSYQDFKDCPEWFQGW